MPLSSQPPDWPRLPGTHTRGPGGEQVAGTRLALSMAAHPAAPREAEPGALALLQTRCLPRPSATWKRSTFRRGSVRGSRFFA